MEERIQITKEENNISIIIPAKKDPKLFTFLSVWLIGWFVGGITAIWHLFAPDTVLFARIFIGIWLVIWYRFLIMMYQWWSWKKFGIEVLTLTPEKLFHQITIRSKKTITELLPTDIMSIRPTGNFDEDKNTKNPFDETKRGTVSITENNGNRTKVGIKLDESEAENLSEIITAYYKIAT